MANRNRLTLLVCLYAMTTVSAWSLFSASSTPRCYFPDDQSVDAPLWLCDSAEVTDYALKKLFNTDEFQNDFRKQKELLIEVGGRMLHSQLQNHYLHAIEMRLEWEQVTPSQQQAIRDSLLFDQHFALETRMVRNRTSPEERLYAVIALSVESIEFLVTQALAKLIAQTENEAERLSFTKLDVHAINREIVRLVQLD